MKKCSMHIGFSFVLQAQNGMQNMTDKRFDKTKFYALFRYSTL